MIKTNKLIHIAVIPDGNRVYAKKYNISYKESYGKSAKVITSIIKWLLIENKIKVLSIYGLSLDNLKNRSKKELKTILSVQEETYKK